MLLFGQRKVLKKLNEGLLLLNRRYRVIYANPKACKLLGLPKDRLKKGTDFLKLGILVTPIKQCRENSLVIQDRFNGSDLKISPLKPGIMITIAGHQTLGKEFVANASHELRTPITIIKGFAETLRDVPELSGDMLDEITQKIIRNCLRMSHLVKNLLTLADIENISQSKLQSVDLGGLIDGCISMLKTVHKSATVNLSVQNGECFVNADPDLLELALSNLLENAVKYSEGPANITISISLKKDAIKLSIADKGLGIPDDDVDHIFDRFYTVNKAHSRKLGGAGLGLSIVKSIIKLHKGTISVSSKIGQGTLFTILLPKLR
ncbi:MAG: Adaptive-response sensory-kinase SasA [Chlamydiia bacterium]|nr:Adaptive-response sensory-kinase SasA [Chlamydiia bacterium]MCH9616279.1 Adaptive-response sensory-kinase SasA [Chlamydiia bacterium]MCH9629735.1 Adaptive-response sensory-kinase SasA [Chlamydiia bacterium]